MCHDRHETACARVAIKDTVILAVHASVNSVQQTVSQTLIGMHQKRGGEDAFAARRKGHFDRVIHPAGHDGFDGASFGTSPKYVRRLSLEGRTAQALVGLFGKRALAPVDPAIRAEVEIVAAVRNGLPVEPHLALFGDSVVIVVGEFPDLWRRGHIQRTVEPHRSFRKHQLVGEDRALIKGAIVVGIHQPHDAMRQLLKLNVQWFVRSAGIRHVQSSTLIEVSIDRPIHQRLPGNLHNVEPIRQDKVMTVQFVLVRKSRPGQNASNKHQQQSHSRTPPRFDTQG